MKIFQWNKQFETKLEDVDRQHHQLVDLINEFSDVLIKDEIDSKYLHKILGDLVEYAKYHFAEEEMLMEKFAIDERFFNAHVMVHQQFVYEIGRILPGLEKDIKAKAGYLLEYLRHWLAFHILREDQEMANQIEAINSGLTPAQAYDVIHKDREEENPLVNAMDGLFKILSERNKELSDLNRTLEEKVSARTRDLKEANLSLERLSLTDFLTQLPNRRYGMQMLTHALEESRQKGASLSCMMIDADHFKEVNDSFGHAAGDDVLVELAQSLKYSCRSDDIVCRLGGDEFLVICPGTGHKGAMKLAAQILENVQQLHVAVGSGVWNGSISIGVASIDKAMLTESQLVQLADECVYKAKANGKNCIESVKQ